MLENELEVQKALRRLGYAVIEPGNLSFAKQVEIFKQARVVIGAHGSAFGNVVFAQPGAHVIDLMPVDWVYFRDRTGTRERWLLNVTTALSLEYTALLCASRQLDGPIRHGKRPIIYNVDIARLKNLASTLEAGGTRGLRGFRFGSKLRAAQRLAAPNWLRFGLRKLGMSARSR